VQLHYLARLMLRWGATQKVQEPNNENRLQRFGDISADGLAAQLDR
jgi:hypothetical protein